MNFFLTLFSVYLYSLSYTFFLRFFSLSLPLSPSIKINSLFLSIHDVFSPFLCFFDSILFSYFNFFTSSLSSPTFISDAHTHSLPPALFFTLPNLVSKYNLNVYKYSQLHFNLSFPPFYQSASFFLSCISLQHSPIHDKGVRVLKLRLNYNLNGVSFQLNNRIYYVKY